MEKGIWEQTYDWSVVRTFFAISDAYTAICELIDNSLAAKAREIRIELDEDNDCLTFTDCKGYGMNEQELREELMHWGREKPVDVLRFFGGGGKGAWGYLGTDVRVLSTPKSMEATYILNLPDFMKRTIKGDVKVPAEKVTPPIFSVPTVGIEMRKLKVRIDISVLMKKIANTYASALRQGVKIIVKRMHERKLLSKTVRPVELPIDVINKVDRKTADGKGTIRGELGLKNKEGIAGGIRCSQGTIGRLISRETFGFEDERDVNLDKIIGWIDNDFVPFTMNKDSFQKGTPEYEEFYDIIREELAPVINLVRKEVIAPVEMERAMPQVERRINKIIQDLEWPVSAHGKGKPKTKKIQELLLSLAKERGREKGEVRHQTQPKDTDRGIRERKGGVRLHLEARANQSTRSWCEASETGIYHIYINSEFPSMKDTYYEQKRTKATDNWVIESTAMELAHQLAPTVGEFRRLVNDVMARTGD